MRLTRREFIKASAASVAWAYAGSALAAAQAKAKPMSFKSALIPRKARPSTPAKGEWVGSTCQGCTQWCAIQLFVSGGRVTRVRGNEFSKSNHGYVCPRGHLITQQTYDPDRVKVPMKRTNPLKGRGVDPKFVPISWDEAITTVADKMLELRAAGEPEKLMYLRGRYGPLSQELLYGTLPKIFGTGNYFSHSALCAEAEKMGPRLTQGFAGYRDYDLEKTNCLVVWGCDPLSSNRQVPNTIHRFHEIVARGTVISVDPRLSTAAAKSHEWLPVLPGTDGALAGAIAHVILTEATWNREFVGDFKDGKNLFVAGSTVAEDAFVEKETHGLVKWWNLELKDRTPAFAAKECGIPAEQILRVARAMAKSGPNTAVWMGPGVAMWPRGTYAAMAVYALNGLLGSIDVVVFESAPGPKLNKFPSKDAFIDEVAKKGSKNHDTNRRGSKDLPAFQTAAVNDVPNMLLKNPGATKVLLASWNNFNHSATGADRWNQVLAKVPFFAHMVTNPSEMTQFADIVLPSTFNSSEGWNIVTNGSNGYTYASIQQSPIKRVFDVKQEETEVMWLLGQKLKAKGFPNLADYYDTIKDPETGKSATTSLEFAETVAKFLSAPIWDGKEEQKGDAPIKGWAAFKAKGMFHGPRYTLKKGWGGKFKSETKKFEFYSATLKKLLDAHAKKHQTTVDDILAVSGYTAKGDLAFVPHYEVPKRHGSFEEYPFTFIDHKSRLNREGRSQNVPWYHEFKKVDPGDVSWGDVVKMNPADGAKLGLKTGDKVTITSQAGSITVDLSLWEGVRPGTVAKCYGQGHWAYGRVATKDYAKAVPLGGNNNEILVDDYDRLSGATARNGGFTGVRITKA
ncbi:MAG: molybdopterin-dependent oxidoreductase [Sulfuritalea sp.]|nr:molybdopterin-dependent oxidoreductase [Sulfuritalea sp.]MDP1981030.1 molybdopterin-dependent oxidoreductase [Sulfuritalea sp.]